MTGGGAGAAYMAGMIRIVPARWEGAILVCGKCSRRAKGGFGPKGRTGLAKLLRQAGVGGKGRKATRGIVEVGCLKLCPRRAVVTVDTAAPDRWRVVPVGADTETVLAAFSRPEERA